MTNINKKLIAALVFPIICLCGLTIFKAVKIYSGTTIIIPITGYDPRDLLSGHYLTYRLELNTSICRDEDDTNKPVYLCITQNIDNTVESERIDYYEMDEMRGSCDVILKGRCDGWRFTAGVERFYIPEEHSRLMDRLIRNKKGALVLKIDRQGNAAIKDLLIDNKPWKSYINEAGKEK